MLERALIEILHGALLPGFGFDRGQDCANAQKGANNMNQSHGDRIYLTVMGSEKLPVTI